MGHDRGTEKKTSCTELMDVDVDMEDLRGRVQLRMATPFGLSPGGRLLSMKCEDDQMNCTNLIRLV